MFGFEFELKQAVRNTNTMLEICNQALQTAGFDDKFSEYESKSYWTFKTDHCGWEFTSPALRSNPTNLNKVGYFIKAMKKSLKRFPENELFYRHTGFHVHVDASNITSHEKSHVARAIVKFEPTLVRLNDKCRLRNHSYCMHARRRLKNALSNTTSSLTRDISAFISKYNIIKEHTSATKSVKDIIQKALANQEVYQTNDLHRKSPFYDHNGSLSCDTGHGTLEWRHGLASFDSEQIKNWIATCIFIQNAALENKIKLFEKDLTPSHDLSKEGLQNNAQELIKWLRATTYSESWMKPYQRNLIRWINKRMRASWKHTYGGRY